MQGRRKMKPRKNCNGSTELGIRKRGINRVRKEISKSRRTDRGSKNRS
jgi:hypothetical protein